MEQLEEMELFNHLNNNGAFLGIETVEVTKQNMAKFGLSTVRGVAVEKVVENSPAQQAGVQNGDVIVAINGEEVSSIRKMMRQMYPNSVFTCVQGQISIWLITIFAGTSEVADFGALSRLAILFAVFQGPLAHWIGPAFSRANSQKKLCGIAVGAFALLASVSLPILLLVILKPSWLLTILGTQYGHLQRELLLVVASMLVGAAVNVSWCLVYARGWVRTAWLNIPCTILAQVTALFFVPIDSVAGVALLSICVSSAQLVHGGSILLSGILRRSVRFVTS